MDTQQSTFSTGRYTCGKHGSAPFLGDDNYTKWLLDMKMMLLGLNVFDIVDGSEPAPPAAAARAAQQKYLEWKCLAASIIWNSLSPSARQTVVDDAEDPQRTWENLKRSMTSLAIRSLPFT